MAQGSKAIQNTFLMGASIFATFLTTVLLAESSFSDTNQACAQIVTAGNSSPSEVVTRDPKEIKSLIVISHNVDRIIGQRGTVEQLNGIARPILIASPDIVILQEVDTRYIQRFVDTYLGSIYQPWFVRGNDRHLNDIVFLVRKDLPLQPSLASNKGARWNDPVTGKFMTLFPRDLPILTLRPLGMPQAKPRMIVVGNHAKAIFDGDEDEGSQRFRRAQYDEAMRLIGQIEVRHGSDIPEIFAGDFQADISDNPEELAALKGRFFDSLAQVEYQGRFSHVRQDPSDRRNKVLLTQKDGILVNSMLVGNIKQASVLNFAPQYDEKGRPIAVYDSPHRPILTTFDTKTIFPEAH